jgi:membrane protease YdiL (CAAX protease family)
LYHGGADVPAGPIMPADAWRLLAAGIGAIYGLQILLAIFGAGGVVASAVSDVGCIALFWWYARHKKLRARDLGFAKVGGLWYGAAVLVGASAWYVNLTIVSTLHVPEGPNEVLQGLLEETPLVSTIAAIAVLPAFAEEIVFRGVLARALGRTRPAWQAVGLSAGVFGLYHVFPAQAVATFLLGCLLGFFALRSKSIVPGIIVHFLNNAIAIVISRESVRGLGDWMGRHQALTLALAVTALLAGIAMAVAAPRSVDEEAIA